MRTRLLSGGTWICGKTIVPSGLTGPQLSFNFTVRNNKTGGMIMKRKLAAFLAAIVMLTAIAIPASAREVVYYYFTLYETNETDQTGCFDWANGYLVKATSYRDAAIRVDTNSGNYSVRTTINANQYTRATDWAWIDAGGRATPSYLSGHGIQGSPYILWVRRNAAESAYSTAISGSWSPDEY